jgi:UDP-3-O-[3-hydroxymyristoyl] glucosamine N-acyltransferase
MIEVEELIIGKNTFISPKAKIVGLDGKAKKVVIGDNTYIGDDVQIMVDEI